MINKEGLCFKYAVNKLGKAFVVCYENEGVYHAYPIDFKSHNMLKHDLYRSEIKLEDYSLKKIIGGLQYLKEELEIIYIINELLPLVNDDKKSRFYNCVEDVVVNTKHPYSVFSHVYESDYVQNKVKELISYLLKNKTITLDVDNLNIVKTNKNHDVIKLFLTTGDGGFIYNKVYFSYRNTNLVQEKYYNIENLYDVCYYTIINMLFQSITGIFDIDSKSRKKLNTNPYLRTYCDSSQRYNFDFNKLYFLIPIFLNLVNNEYTYNFKDINKLVQQAEERFDSSFIMINTNKYYYILLYIADYYDTVSKLNELEKMSFESSLKDIKTEELIVRYLSNLARYREILLELEEYNLK